MGKGEIARYEQFLLFPLCFQKFCLPGASKSVIVWEWVNPLLLITELIAMETFICHREIEFNSASFCFSDFQNTILDS